MRRLILPKPKTAKPQMRAALMVSLIVVGLVCPIINGFGQSQQVTYVYDSLNRLTEVRYATGVIRYTYDAAGNRTQLQIEGLNPVPSLINLSPGSALAGSSGFTLVITGSNFASGAVVKWNGSNRTATVNSETQVQATIPNTDIASTGAASITVTNPAPGGGTSNALNFNIVSSCSFSIAPANQAFAPGVGNGIVNVTSPSGCNWTAVRNDSWITINSGANGSANGTVTFTVAANGGGARTGTVTIAGQTFTVNQSGTGCSYSIAPTSKSFGSDAGNGSVDVTATNGCNWTANTNDFWITTNSGASGTGNGTVNYSVAANTNFGSRSGTIIITGQTFTINQEGAPQPTAINLESFIATAYDSGVFIEWRTGLEVENLGFHVYREQAGQRTRITPEIVAGSALIAGNKTTLTAGNAYAWWDALSKEKQDAQYWLEDIDIDGKSTLHGPIKPRLIAGLPPDQSTAALLSRIGAGQPRINQVGANQAVRTAPSRERIEAQWDIASKPAIKLTIKEEGWYRVTQAELIVAGLDSKTDPRNLQLFLEGDEQAMLVAGEQDGSFDRTDSIEFYATGQDTPSTDAHVYWLVSGKQPGKRINIIKSDAKPGGAKSFSYTVERKERTLYFSSLRNGDAENFFGRVITAQPVDQGLTIQHLDPTAGEVVLEVALQGVTDLPGVINDHQVKVTLNGAQVGRIIFDGTQHPVEKFVVPQGALKEGDNVVTLVAEAGPSDISLVDEIRVTYRHTYMADQDALRMTVVEQASLVVTRSQTIEGFTAASIRVADITDPSQPQELIGRIEEQKGASYAATVEVTSNAQRTLMAFTADRIKHPVSIAANQPSSWRDTNHRADLLMITHRLFASSLAPLKALRQKQGFAVEVVDIEDIYDEFNFGEKSPQAVKDFLAFAHASWRLAPRYVLLVGDPSYDPKNYLGAGDFDFAPTKLIDTTYLETASDDWFADFNDDGLPEMYVGRLPVRTAAEATAVVTKIVGYDAANLGGPAGRRSVLLVADKNDGFNFEQASEQLSALVPVGTAVQSIFRGRLDDATAKKQLIGSINSGQSIVNYTGHGSTNVWRSLFTTSDVQSLENKSLPLFITMTCLNGFIQDPVIESLGKSLIKSDRGGAVAVWTSSGLTLPAQQALINQQLYRVIFGSSGVKGQPLTIGEAIAKAKAATKDLDVRRTWLLLGDPTMVVK